eukprot:4506551-Amphidinium_carterae.1
MEQMPGIRRKMPRKERRETAKMVKVQRTVKEARMMARITRSLRRKMGNHRLLALHRAVLQPVEGRNQKGKAIEFLDSDEFARGKEFQGESMLSVREG